MTETVLTLVNGAALLIFGTILAASFAGLRFTKRNVLIFLCCCVFSGVVQLAVLAVFSEVAVRMAYPLIAHLPLILLLRAVFRKSLPFSVISVFTAYLCCQPSSWMGTVVLQLTRSTTAQLITHTLMLIPVSIVMVKYVFPLVSNIFDKDERDGYFLGIVPTGYYIFDYVVMVYTDIWVYHWQVAMESLTVLLTTMHVLYCLYYYRNYERRIKAEHKEQIIRITANQQANEIDTIKRSSRELRLLRHDLRMVLGNLRVAVENGDTKSACNMIDSYIGHIDGTKLERFCDNDTVNYVLSNYAARCENAAVPLQLAVELEKLDVDEIMFSSILSNALDNALNAQHELPADRRCIRLMLKNSGEKLLLSVQNPVEEEVSFVDGLPVTNRDGHGYGAKSIRYLTEKLGGSCQFSVQEDLFTLRVVL